MSIPGIRLVALAAAAVAALHASAAGAAAPPIERPGMYVVAEDVEKSAAFYEQIFGRPPQVKMPTFVGFDVAGALFAVASREAYAPDARVGGNVVPYLKVNDIEDWFAHVRSVAPERLTSAEVHREGPISLFKFRDIDGNLVEIFAVRTGE